MHRKSVKIRSMGKKQKECLECAGNPTIHWAAYTSALMTYLMKPFEGYLNLMSRVVDPISDKLTPSIPSIYESLAKIGFGHIYSEPPEKDSWKIKCMWEEAKKRGIKMRKFSLFKNSRGTYWAQITDEVTPNHVGGDTSSRAVCFDSLPRPDGPMSKALAWMDDKGIMRNKFTKAGIPVARGGVAVSERKGLKIFRSLNKPVITKPNLGSRSRHTTIHINTEEEFLKAFRSAKQLSPWVVIEEELKGMVFRGTIIGGKVAAVMRREPPHVIADGSHTVLELMEEANKNPKRHGPIFHEIPRSEEAEADLKLQNLNWESIPQRGRLVTLGQKVGRTTGASTTDVTNIIHPENIKLLEKIYSVLKEPLIGVDFIIEDIQRPWQEQQKCGVIECNSMPFIDLHHYPLFGEPQNVAGKLWDIIFPQT